MSSLFARHQIIDVTSIPTKGTIQLFSGTTSPNGWLICDGQAISRVEYEPLFTVIGTSYGSGDGSTTFNLPNFKGKIPVGYDTSQTEFNSLGKTGGEKAHKLTVNEIPSHTHSVTQQAAHEDRLYAPLDENKTIQSNVSNTATGSAGGDLAHNNIQPYITVNYIIKY